MTYTYRNLVEDVTLGTHPWASIDLVMYGRALAESFDASTDRIVSGEDNND